MITLQRILPPQVENIAELAKVEDHGVLEPTHIVYNDTAVAGCLSVGSIPMMLAWIGKANSAFDSKKIVDTVENSLRFSGCRYLAIPCGPLSPFFPLMEKAGYTKVYENTLFIKAL
jgi:hypothetical protein